MKTTTKQVSREKTEIMKSGSIKFILDRKRWKILFL